MLCVGLAGCGLREGWTKADANDQDVKAALYACEKDMRIAQQGPPFFRRCMESKGYEQK